MIASTSTHLSSSFMSQDGITGSVDIKIVPLRNDRKLTRETKVQLNNPRGVVNKVLYGEAPIRGPTLSLLYTIFDRKGKPFIYLPLKNDTPFTYRYRTSHSRAVASGGGGGGKGESCPPGPVEPDKSSLWMDLFSLDSFILVIVTCNCLPLSNSRSIFRRRIS